MSCGRPGRQFASCRMRTIPKGEGENSVGSVGGCAATTDRSLDTFGDGEVTREKTETDTAREESTPTDRAHSFWSSLSLTELAEAQGVAPVEDLAGLAALWPSDDEPDEVLAHVLAERAARRRVAGMDSAFATLTMTKLTRKRRKVGFVENPNDNGKS